MNLSRKIWSFTLLVAICAATGLCLRHSSGSQSKAYVAIGYYASKHGANAEGSAAIGLIGVWHSGLVGATYGMAFGPIGSIVGGAAVGL